MSLILDALQRSEEQQSQTPSAISGTVTPVYKSSRRFGVAHGIVLGVVMSCVTGFVLIWSTPKDSADPIKDPVGGSSESRIADVEAPSGVIKANRTGQGAGDSAEEGQLALAHQPTEEAANTAHATRQETLAAAHSSDQRAVGALYANAKTQGSPTSAAQAAQVSAVETELDSDSVNEQRVDIEALLRKAQAELGETPLVPHAAPLIERLSQQQKDRIPSLIYTVHDLSGGTPTVVINGKRLTIGDRLDGLTIEDILVDSAVMSWGGTTFRLPALNSWVNL